MNNQEYVTYKWLFMTATSILVISLGFIYFAFTGITKSLDSKADVKWVETRAEVNAARINVLSIQLDKMESKQDEILRLLLRNPQFSKDNK